MSNEVTLGADVEAMLAEMEPAKAEVIRKALLRQAKSRRLDVATLEAKHTHLIPGSVGFDAEAKKQFGMIKCKQPGCENTRRVFTSDLWQVTVCVSHRDAARKAKAEERKALLETFKKDMEAKKQEAAS